MWIRRNKVADKGPLGGLLSLSIHEFPAQTSTPIQLSLAYNQSPVQWSLPQSTFLVPMPSPQALQIYRQNPGGEKKKPQSSLPPFTWKAQSSLLPFAWKALEVDVMDSDEQEEGEVPSLNCQKHSQIVGPDESAESGKIREQAQVAVAYAMDTLLATQAVARVGHPTMGIL